MLKREINAPNLSLSILLHFSVIYAPEVVSVVSGCWKCCASICHPGGLKLAMAAAEIGKCCNMYCLVDCLDLRK